MLRVARIVDDLHVFADRRVAEAVEACLNRPSLSVRELYKDGVILDAHNSRGRRDALFPQWCFVGPQVEAGAQADERQKQADGGARPASVEPLAQPGVVPGGLVFARQRLRVNLAGSPTSGKSAGYMSRSTQDRTIRITEDGTAYLKTVGTSES